MSIWEFVEIGNFCSIDRFLLQGNGGIIFTGSLAACPLSNPSQIAEYFPGTR
jgi:hypothetical protein